MRVYLAQLKCANNHCIMALAGEFDVPSDIGSEERNAAIEGLRLALETRTREQFDQLVASGALKRECWLCHGTTFHVDVGRTRWRTMEDALPSLRALEAQQLRSRDQVMNRN